MGFAAGFRTGWDSVSEGLRERERQAMLKGVQSAMEAKPETSEGFTAEQGEQLRLAAESGQYDIGYDESKKAYTVTPKVGGETGLIAQQGVTDFMGQRTAGTLTPGQVNNARNMAIADALKKFDPVRGMQIEQQAIASQRDDLRFGNEQKNWGLQDEEADRQRERYRREQQNWGRKDRELAEEDEYKEGRRRLFSSSKFGQNQQSYNQAVADYQRRLTEYETAKASGKTGPELGLAPVAPVRPQYTPGDALADRAALIDHDAKFGKLDARAFGEFTDMLNRVQSEGYERTLQLAQAGGTIEEVARSFNSTGKVQFDPANMISDKRVKNPDGVETRVIEFKDSQGNTRTINTVAELAQLGKAGEVFNRFFQAEQNRRGDAQLELSQRQDARAATNQDHQHRIANAQLELSQRQDARANQAQARALEEAAAVRRQQEHKAASAVALYRENNPGATPAQLEAVRRGILQAVPQTDGSAPSEVKLAQAMVAAGLAPDMRRGLEMALTKKTQDPNELHKEFVAAGIKNMAKPEDAVAAADKVMNAMGYTRANGRWSMAAPKLQNVTDADIKATAQKYGISEAEVRRRLGLQ